MAKYFLHVKVFSRGKGSRVTRAAAYRAGERIRDERTSEVYNYTGREDVLHKEIVLASELAGRTDTSWARERGMTGPPRPVQAVPRGARTSFGRSPKCRRKA